MPECRLQVEFFFGGPFFSLDAQMHARGVASKERMDSQLAFKLSEMNVALQVTSPAFVCLFACCSMDHVCFTSFKRLFELNEV